MNAFPHRPRSIEDHRSGFLEAITRIVRDPGPRDGTPPISAANLFDFEDGLRLVITCGVIDDFGHIFHMSASAEAGSRVYLAIGEGRLSPFMFRSMAIQRYIEISLDHRTWSFAGYSPNTRCPNWASRVDGGTL